MARPRFLLLTDNPPRPVTSGGAQRTALLQRALAEIGDVDLFFIDRFRAGEQQLTGLRAHHGMVDAVTPWGDSRAIAGRLRYLWHANRELAAPLLGDGARLYTTDARVDRALRRQLSAVRYDLVVARYLRATALSGVLAHARVALDLDDDDRVLWSSRLHAPGLSRMERRAAAHMCHVLDTLMPPMLARCAHVWVPAHTDTAAPGLSHASVLPNIPWNADAIVEASPVRSDVVLLVAAMGHDANARAVDRFVVQCWPRVRAAHARATLRIIGSGMSDRQRRRWSVPGVTAVGQVDELAPEYAAAAFAVAPVWDGAGTKIKVLEALIHGRAVVATQHAMRGLDDVLQHDRAVLAAADDAGLAQSCIALLGDPARAARLAAEGAALVRAHYSWDRFAAAVRTAVLPLVASPAGAAR